MKRRSHSYQLKTFTRRICVLRKKKRKKEKRTDLLSHGTGSSRFPKPICKGLSKPWAQSPPRPSCNHQPAPTASTRTCRMSQWAQIAGRGRRPTENKEHKGLCASSCGWELQKVKRLNIKSPLNIKSMCFVAKIWVL